MSNRIHYDYSLAGALDPRTGEHMGVGKYHRDDPIRSYIVSSHEGQKTLEGELTQEFFAASPDMRSGTYQVVILRLIDFSPPECPTEVHDEHDPRAVKFKELLEVFLAHEGTSLRVVTRFDLREGSVERAGRVRT